MNTKPQTGNINLVLLFNTCNNINTTIRTILFDVYVALILATYTVRSARLRQCLRLETKKDNKCLINGIWLSLEIKVKIC